MVETAAVRSPGLASLKASLSAHRKASSSPAVPAGQLAAFSAAAVSSFFDPDELAARLIPADAEEILARLKRECVTTVRDGKHLWFINGHRRRAHLSRLASSGLLRQSVRNHRVGEDDAISHALQAYVGGGAKPVSEQAHDELVASEQVVSWLSGLSDGLPDPSEIRAALARADLLRPLLEIAGPGSHFSGRGAELERLRAFVGTASTDGSIERWMVHLRGLVPRPNAGAISISGVGGAGKSTLLAKFILDHARVDDPPRVPFCYLDFDRASLVPDDAGGLVLEMLRQLSCQYPVHASEFEDEIRALGQSYLATELDAREETATMSMPGGSAGPSSDPRVGAMVDGLAKVLGRIRVLDKPLLLVLDTFEEAEYRSAAGMPILADLIRRLFAAVPSLRLVVSGRAVPRYIPVGDKIDLEALDHDSAVGFLEAHGLAPDVADAVADQVGGLPLSLRLAIEVIRREGVDDGGVKRLDVHGWFGIRYHDSRILTQLYGRILDHIHDPEVRRIAHPGLVIRRITPGVIRDVIGPVVGMDLGMEGAEALYDGLRREVALVVDEGNQLRHRQDVRAEMLALMTRDDGGQVAELNRRAMSYWADQFSRSHDVRDRAEEIYHALQSGRTFAEVEGIWVPGVAGMLRSSVHELTPASEATLLLLLDGVTDSLDAGGEGSDRLASSLVEAAVHVRRDDPKRALKVLGKLPRALRRSVEATMLRAEALDRSLRWDEAVRALDELSAAQAADPRVVRKRADLAFRTGRLDEALAAAEVGARKQVEPLGFLELVLVGLACAKLLPREASRVSLAAQARDGIERVGAFEHRSHPHLLRRYALLAGDEVPAAVETFLRKVGMTRQSSAEMSALAQTMAAWDGHVSRTMGVKPGLLAALAGLPVSAGTDIGLEWTRFVAHASDGAMRNAFAKILDAHPLDRTDANAFAEIIRFRCPEWRPAARRALESAIPDRRSLAAVAAVALGVSSEDADPVSGATMTHSDVVRLADTEGLLMQLLRAAHATDRSPGLAVVTKGLSRWLDASAWGRSDDVPPRALTRRNEVPGIPMFDLVRRFYELDFIDRVALGRRFGLIHDGDESLDVAGMSQSILSRAAGKGLLVELAESLGLARI